MQSPRPRVVVVGRAVAGPHAAGPRGDGHVGREGTARRAMRLTLHVALGFVASAALVLPATQRAFAGPVDGVTGQLVVTGAEQLADGGPLTPGERRRACVTVAYTGAGDATVRLVPDIEDGGLATHLELRIDEAAAGCAPTATAPLVAGNLDDLDDRPTEMFATSTATTRSYTVTLTAAPALPSGATAGVDLAWSITR